jgi:hypothetical protein
MKDYLFASSKPITINMSTETQQPIEAPKEEVPQEKKQRKEGVSAKIAATGKKPEIMMYHYFKDGQLANADLVPLLYKKEDRCEEFKEKFEKAKELDASLAKEANADVNKIQTVRNELTRLTQIVEKKEATFIGNMLVVKGGFCYTVSSIKMQHGPYMLSAAIEAILGKLVAEASDKLSNNFRMKQNTKHKLRIEDLQAALDNVDVFGGLTGWLKEFLRKWVNKCGNPVPTKQGKKTVNTYLPYPLERPGSLICPYSSEDIGLFKRVEEQIYKQNFIKGKQLASGNETLDEAAEMASVSEFAVRAQNKEQKYSQSLTQGSLVKMIMEKYQPKYKEQWFTEAVKRCVNDLYNYLVQIFSILMVQTLVSKKQVSLTKANADHCINAFFTAHGCLSKSSLYAEALKAADNIDSYAISLAKSKKKNE